MKTNNPDLSISQSELDSDSQSLHHPSVFSSPSQGLTECWINGEARYGETSYENRILQSSGIREIDIIQDHQEYRDRINHKVLVLDKETSSSPHDENFATSMELQTSDTADATESERKGDNKSARPRRFPCRARGLRDSTHTTATAYLEVPANAKHGALVMCCHAQCAKSGRMFRYCAVCDVPVAKRNFMKRHSHGLVASVRYSFNHYFRDQMKERMQEGCALTCIDVDGSSLTPHPVASRGRLDSSNSDTPCQSPSAIPSNQVSNGRDTTTSSDLKMSSYTAPFVPFPSNSAGATALCGKRDRSLHDVVKTDFIHSSKCSVDQTAPSFSSDGLQYQNQGHDSGIQSQCLSSDWSSFSSLENGDEAGHHGRMNLSDASAPIGTQLELPMLGRNLRQPAIMTDSHESQHMTRCTPFHDPSSSNKEDDDTTSQTLEEIFSWDDPLSKKTHSSPEKTKGVVHRGIEKFKGVNELLGLWEEEEFEGIFDD